jgi:DNA-binding NtrC family response regulator
MVEVHVPSLTDRQEDLPLLIRFFIERFSAQFRKEIRGLTQRAHIVLARHSFPGNVRELENILGHGCMMAQGPTVDVQDLPEYLRFPSQNPHASPQPVAVPPIPDAETFEAHEKHLISEALSRAAGNQSQAARALRIGRDALRYKMRKHGLL